jgi:hypothetical protein
MRKCSTVDFSYLNSTLVRSVYSNIGIFKSPKWTLLSKFKQETLSFLIRITLFSFDRSVRFTFNITRFIKDCRSIIQISCEKCKWHFCVGINLRACIIFITLNIQWLDLARVWFRALLLEQNTQKLNQWGIWYHSTVQQATFMSLADGEYYLGVSVERLVSGYDTLSTKILVQLDVWSAEHLCRHRVLSQRISCKRRLHKNWHFYPWDTAVIQGEQCSSRLTGTSLLSDWDLNCLL